jgi:hypothetical protein
MSRRVRVALELLGPSLVASVLFTVAISAVALAPTGLALLPIVLLYAYPLGALPAAIFTLVLEVAFSRGLSPGSWGAVRLAALLGLLSGAAIAAPFSSGPEKTLEALAIFPALGTLTGAVVGLVVKARSS